MKTLNTTTTEVAMQIVIMDATQKGHTNTKRIIEFMKSEVFETAVLNYKEMLESEFEK